MNFLHLKYIVEVNKAKSINKAAENLFMAQPNLSRAIKELEDSLGITIFNRTSKGMELTEQGVEFVKYAEKILKEVDELETTFLRKKRNLLEFSFAHTRSLYVAMAFNNFLTQINNEKAVEINYKETNAMKVIKRVVENGYKMGVLGYSSEFEAIFNSVLKEKGLEQKEISTFSRVVVTKKNNALDNLEQIFLKDLQGFTQILYGDPYVPTMSGTDVKNSEFVTVTDKNVYVYERSSMFEYLDSLDGSFAISAPLPNDVLLKYNLVQRKINDYDKLYKEILIYKKGYKFTELDNMFLSQLDLIKTSMEAGFNGIK